MINQQNQRSDQNQHSNQTALEQTDELIKETGRPLLEVKTVFPFTLFPKRIKVNEQIVNLIYQPFFFSKETYPILVTGIENVQVATNPFFGSLKIEISGHEENPTVISFLPKSQAIKLRKLIMGLKVLAEEGVDVSSLERETLIEKAIQLGSTHSTAGR